MRVLKKAVHCFTAAAIAAVLVAAPARAGIEEELEDMFGSMTNVTNPTAHEGQRRGILSGGRISVRNKVVRPQAIGFTPPSISAGCQGIDIYGGSFSYISKDQFVATLRAIASNAKGYAFGLAVEAMCPSCAQKMEDLQKAVMGMNEWVKDSCTAGRWLVDQTGLDGWSENARNRESAVATAIGKAADALEGWHPSGSTPGNMVNEAIASGDPKAVEAAKDVYGNVVWAAMKKADVATWFRRGDDRLLETLMSVTGSVVIGSTEDADGNKVPAPVILPPTIDFHDILNGTRSEISIYDCSADTESCMIDPSSTTTRAGFDGIRPRLESIIKGNPAAGDLGLIAKFQVNYDGPLDDDEKAILEVSPIGAMIRQLNGDRFVSGIIADAAIDIIAIEMTSALLEEMLQAVEQAVASHDMAGSKGVLAQIEKVMSQVSQARRDAAEQRKGTADLVALYQRLLETRRKAVYLGQPDTQQRGEE